MEELYTEYPPPWVVDDNREGHEGLVTVFAANGRAVVCTGEGYSWADILNARLFASAPDLLKALTELVESCTNMHGQVMTPSPVYVDQARAAITKATEGHDG